MVNQPSATVGLSRKVRILVVEDESIIAINLKESLEALGYDVPEIVASAETAVSTAVELRPDLVLMDIRLRGNMDGIQAAERIWNTLQIPVIYVTGHSDVSTLERAKVTLPYGYILKPIKERELYAAIEIALQRHQREQLLTSVLQDMGEGLIVTDTQSRVMFLNRVAEQLTGWQQGEARGQQVTEVFRLINAETRRSIPDQAIAAVQQDRIVRLNERALLIAKDGTEISVSDSVAPLTNGRGLITGAVLVFRDETRQYEATEHDLTVQRAQILERQRLELQTLNYLKDEFLTAISRELQTPLTNIKVAIQLLGLTLDQQSSSDTEATLTSNQWAQYLKILREQCDQELTVMSDLLELQCLKAGGYQLELTSVSLPECISSVVGIFEERAQRQQQVLQVVAPPELPVLISDLAILSRILTELLTNACKHTPAGGEITVTAQPAQDGRAVQLQVCNTGVEIPVDELSRVFDKFYRIPTGNHWQEDGTGLGLTLLKQQVMCLGGSVWADSGLGRTCFTIELPMHPPD